MEKGIYGSLGHSFEMAQKVKSGNASVKSSHNRVVVGAKLILDPSALVYNPCFSGNGNNPCISGSPLQETQVLGE
ncbi:hypothetical protein J6590_074628 [Homalodisca vitripennis]|nr:hypothetical protein J6590_074628 [Homalodisca vitripennis]